MSKRLTVSYDLKPPAGTAIPNIYKTSKVYEFAIARSSSQQEFYKALRDVMLQATAQIGADLTAWRDAVGTLENVKEPKKGKDDDNEDDEDESE